MGRASLKIAITLVAALAAAPPALACDGDSCANGLAYEAFGPKSAPILAVFVHGDVSAGGPADYMYSYARSFAAKHMNVVAVALLRPGYYDSAGRRSDGSDNGRRDTFNASNNRTIAVAIRELKAKYEASKVIALGHSGGAGTLGVIVGNDAGLLDGVVLASCPCDIAAMVAAGRRLPTPWLSPSPVDFISSIPAGTAIVAVTGSADINTRPEIAQDYVAKARAAGLKASVQIVDGGHRFKDVSEAAIIALGEMAR